MARSFRCNRSPVTERLSPRVLWGMRIDTLCEPSGRLRGSSFHRLLKDLAFLRRNKPVASWMRLRRIRVAAPPRLASLRTH